jgi:hypothetical protein
MEGDLKMETKLTLPHKLIDIIKNRTAILGYCKSGRLYYNILVENTLYTFPVDVTDRNEVGDATFELTDKASIFMRYINKAIKALDGDKPDDMIRWETV